MEAQDHVEGTEAGRGRTGFYIHLAAYVVVNASLAVLNWLTSPGHYWFQWPLLGWGLGILAHAGFCFFRPKRAGGRQRQLATELRTKGRKKRRSHVQ